ncbi:MAG TPA: NTP transferase domain-containing protein [Candidatus Baltobacteraceae bacterium]|nr:NTP transferase domain-containing protein [Candidatus Baltobacteraceae bacterium]
MVSQSTYAAVITAGGRVDSEFAGVIGTPVKALAPFAGSTFLAIAIAAVREIGLERIAVVGGSEVRAACAASVERVIDESEDGTENLRRALFAWDEQTPLLYVTSDMPFIDGDALRGFLRGVPPKTLALPLTEWAEFERRFPDPPPFGITLAGEKVVNGGAFVIPPRAHTAIENFAMRFFEARKSVWQMARLAGPALLLRFVFRRLGVAQLEAHARRQLGIPALAVRNAPPELAYDVDVLAEYRYAITRA